jgi:hypothetical protein
LNCFNKFGLICCLTGAHWPCALRAVPDGQGAGNRVRGGTVSVVGTHVLVFALCRVFPVQVGGGATHRLFAVT